MRRFIVGISSIVGIAVASGCFAHLQEQMAAAQKQCDADLEVMRQLDDSPPMGHFSGRWSCIYESPEGNGTEAVDLAQNGSRLTWSVRDGYNNAAILDGRIAGNAMVVRRNDGNLTIRLEGNGRMLDGQINTGLAGDCAPRRYTCNRR